MSEGFEHDPWIGEQYQIGVKGKKIAIVGNSHWLRVADSDEPGFTQMVLAGVASGSTKLRFFSSIPPYFKTPHKAFWSSVLFFNYAPWAIGEGHQRYDRLTQEMAETAQKRLLHHLRAHQPDKVFVFSDSIRWALPIHHLHDPRLPSKSTRIARIVDADDVPALYLMRHTQGAKKLEMTETVSALMAI